MAAAVTHPPTRLEPGETLIVEWDGERYAVAHLPPEGMVRVRLRLRRLTPRKRDKGTPPEPYVCRWSPGRGHRCSCKAYAFGKGRHCRHLLMVVDARLMPE